MFEVKNAVFFFYVEGLENDSITFMKQYELSKSRHLKCLHMPQ